MRYRIPHLPLGRWHIDETDVEKSRFIAWIAHTPDLDAVNGLATAAKQAHPSASHHCLAYIAAAPGEQQRIGFSDDGEPGGTAGRPMYHALQGSQLGEIGCVVIRYFGGTKLGTGGLARAYAQAVNHALATLPTREVVERDHYRVRFTFADEAIARAWCDEQAIPVIDAQYDGNGVALTIGWPSDWPLDLGPLESRLKQSLSAQTVSL
ncbi:MAG: IMPACT family protein [Pseudomonadota bacterium]